MTNSYMNNPFEELAAGLGIRIAYFPEITSTNDEARSDVYRDGDIVIADLQTKGRGQRGNSWASNPQDNLTFSLMLQPVFLQAKDQFLLSETVSLALTDMLDTYGIQVSIKWTNDIYIGMRKVTGILIENDVTGSFLSRSIIGIGLNVNQESFGSDLPNPVSMKLAAGRGFDRTEVLGRFYKAFIYRYSRLKEGDCAEIEREYLSMLYLKDTLHTFRLPDETPAPGIIRGVESSGELVIEHPGAGIKRYLFREIEF